MTDNERLDRSSASSFAIDANCPGRQNLLRSLPPEPVEEKPKTEEEKTDDDKMAERGTRLHEAWRSGNFTELDGDELEDYEIGRKFRKSAIDQWCQDNGLTGFVSTREERLWLHDERTLAPILSGQMDEHDIAEKHALILDFKSGWNTALTPSERNWQLRVYAVLLWKEHPELTKIRVGFVKPKASPRFGPDFTDYTLEDLQHAERDIRFHLRRTEQPDAQRVPGGHCRWCRAKAFCVEAGAYALIPSMAVPAGMQPTKEDIKMLVASMTPEALKTIHARASIIGKILEGVKERLKTFTAEDLAALGLGFGKPRKTGSIDKTKECFEDLKAFGINEDELWAALSFSKGELVDALRRDQGWPKDKADGFVKQKVEAFGSTKESAAPIIFQ